MICLHDGLAARRARAACRRAGSWIALAAALLVAGCASEVHEHGDGVSPRQVFAVGFENVADRYIEAIDAGAVTIAGLNKLATFDSSLRVRRVGDMVRLEIASTTRAEHAIPAADDIYGWAWLAADMVEDARRSSTTIARLGNEEIYEAVFEGVLDGFDKYSRYTSAEVAARNRASRDGFGGLGISIAQEDGVTVITQVHRDTPAARAGLKVDDQITHVDGEPIGGLALGSVVSRLRGPVDSPVVVRVARDSIVRPIDVMIRRSHIVLPTVTVRRQGGLLEVKLSGFNQGTARALRRELERADREMGPQLRGVILDLRGNPGGLLDQAVAVADLFLGRGRIVSTKGRHSESNQIFDAAASEIARGVPLAVLVNGRSASAAEIVAVALRDARRAVIIGSTTFGKGTVQTIARLPNGGEMTLTWARLVAPSGQTLDRQGIIPAVCTGAGPQRADTLLKALAKAEGVGGVLPPALLRPQAGVHHYAKAAQEECPPSTAESPADMEAARLVLRNLAVYAQAVSEAPSIANLK